jgi:16S rRNA processing protein RimM
VAPGAAPERVVVGRVLRAHGVRGEVVVEVLSDAPERFARGSRMDAGDPAGERTTLTVAAARPHRGRLLVRFAEVRDRTAAEALRGAPLSIPGEAAAPPPPGSYYAWQLEGLEVVDEAGERLGVLARVLRRPGNDLWVVRTGAGEALVPAVQEFVRAVDLDGGRIVLRPIPGLLD